MAGLHYLALLVELELRHPFIACALNRLAEVLGGELLSLSSERLLHSLVICCELDHSQV